MPPPSFARATKKGSSSSQSFMMKKKNMNSNSKSNRRRKQQRSVVVQRIFILVLVFMVVMLYGFYTLVLVNPDTTADNNSRLRAGAGRGELVVVSPLAALLKQHHPLPRRKEGEGEEESKNKKNIATSNDLQQLQFPPELVNRVMYDEPPKPDPAHSLTFLHIAKTGGRAFDGIGSTIARQLHKKYVSHNSIPRGGTNHFDWSHIDTLENGGADGTDIITMLRDPVSRAISHYFYIRGQGWTQDKDVMQHRGLVDFFRDPQAMLDLRGVWQDGQGAVSWLTGTHIANWVTVPASQVPDRERRAAHMHEMCLLAAQRLDRTVWVGLLSDLDRSLELLAHAFDLPHTPTMSKGNKGPSSHEVPTEWIKSAVASLVPQDLWLWEYGKRLFEARWEYYKNPDGGYHHPALPPLPHPECVSTRFSITCEAGPLAPLVYTDPNAPPDWVDPSKDVKVLEIQKALAGKQII